VLPRNIPAPNVAWNPLPPVPVLALPADVADIQAAYTWVAQLGRAKRLWDNDIKRVIVYIGHTHEDC